MRCKSNYFVSKYIILYYEKYYLKTFQFENRHRVYLFISSWMDTACTFAPSGGCIFVNLSFML